MNLRWKKNDLWFGESYSGVAKKTTIYRISPLLRSRSQTSHQASPTSLNYSSIIMPRIRAKSHHSPHKRTKIVYKYDSGISANQIAEEEGITKHIIFGIVWRYKYQNSAKRKPGSGRPTIISTRDKNHIFRIVDQDPFVTYAEILEQTGLCCYKTTLMWWLRKQGVQHHLSLWRPFLSPAVAQKRLDFA